MPSWMLAIINRQDAANANSSKKMGDSNDGRNADAASVSGSSSSSSLTTSLIDLLQIFRHHAAPSSASLAASSLHGWTTGGAFILTYLELLTNFNRNLLHFTTADAATSLDQRLTNLHAYQTELQDCLQAINQNGQLDIASFTRQQQHQDVGSTQSIDHTTHTQMSVRKLVYSKMSAHLLQLLHALTPLEQQLMAQQQSSSSSQQQQQQAARIQTSLDIVTAGEFVSAADRLAVVNDAKDSWLISLLQQSA